VNRSPTTASTPAIPSEGSQSRARNIYSVISCHQDYARLGASMPEQQQIAKAGEWKNEMSEVTVAMPKAIALTGF